MSFYQDYKNYCYNLKAEELKKEQEFIKEYGVEVLDIQKASAADKTDIMPIAETDNADNREEKEGEM